MSELPYQSHVMMVEMARRDLNDYQSRQFERYTEGEISMEQLSLYRREHHFRKALLHIAYEQLTDIIITNVFGDNGLE